MGHCPAGLRPLATCYSSFSRTPTTPQLWPIPTSRPLRIAAFSSAIGSHSVIPVSPITSLWPPGPRTASLQTRPPLTTSRMLRTSLRRKVWLGRVTRRIGLVIVLQEPLRARITGQPSATIRRKCTNWPCVVILQEAQSVYQLHRYSDESDTLRQDRWCLPARYRYRGWDTADICLVYGTHACLRSKPHTNLYICHSPTLIMTAMIPVWLSLGIGSRTSLLLPPWYPTLMS